MAVLDESVKMIWETNNKGKLWKDIREKYETPEERAERVDQKWRFEWWMSDEPGKFFKGS